MGHTYFNENGNERVVNQPNIENPGKNGAPKVTSFVNAVKKNMPEMATKRFSLLDPEVSLVGDSATISLPKDFWVQSRKRLSSSCIGHFVEGGFSFKFVKERTMKLWGSCGLRNVFYSSKGYFTFEFDTDKEMSLVLGLNSINVGRKHLYLSPWIDGSQFQKNFIHNVSVWVKFVDVPHSYWSWEGLGSIAKAVGKPLALDAHTSTLNPKKYAGILIDLRYSHVYPKRVWVLVINDNDGSIVKVRVDVEYSAIPQSCRHCAAFGHSLARCTLKPKVVEETVSDVLDRVTTVVDPIVTIRPKDVVIVEEVTIRPKDVVIVEEGVESEQEEQIVEVPVAQSPSEPAAGPCAPGGPVAPCTPAVPTASATSAQLGPVDAELEMEEHAVVLDLPAAGLDDVQDQEEGEIVLSTFVKNKRKENRRLADAASTKEVATVTASAHKVSTLPRYYLNEALGHKVMWLNLLFK